jgi:hypothetical protein
MGGVSNEAYRSRNSGLTLIDQGRYNAVVVTYLDETQKLVKDNTVLNNEQKKKLDKELTGLTEAVSTKYQQDNSSFILDGPNVDKLIIKLGDIQRFLVEINGFKKEDSKYKVKDDTVESFSKSLQKTSRDIMAGKRISQNQPEKVIEENGKAPAQYLAENWGRVIQAA